MTRRSLGPLVVLTLACGGGGPPRQAERPPVAAPAPPKVDSTPVISTDVVRRTWDGMEPLYCGGYEVVTIENADITWKQDRDAVEAAGLCRLTLKNCVIRGAKGKNLVTSTGNATLVIDGGRIEGDLLATGIARLELRNVDIQGHVNKSGAGIVIGP